MDKLPSELLEAILSPFDLWELLQLQCVCTRWQTLIDESIWRKRTVITRRDLGMYSSLETQVTRLLQLFRRLPTIDYYYSPVLASAREGMWYSKGFPKETSECLMRLFSVLKDLMSEGRIPVSLATIEFMENVINAEMTKKDLDLAEWGALLFSPDAFFSRCSISACHSLVVPVWPTEDSDHPTCSEWLRAVLHRMAHLEEMVIEEWNVSSSTSVTQLHQLRIASPSLSRVRIFKVVCRDPHDGFVASVRLGPTRQLLGLDEFVHCLDKLEQYSVEYSEHPAIHTVLDVLQSGGRIRDAQIGSSVFQFDVREVQSSLRPEQRGQLDPQPLLRRMLRGRTNYVSVSLDVSHQPEQLPSKALDFLRHRRLRDVTRLSLQFERSADSSDFGATLLRGWDCLVQEDILVRLESLQVHMHIGNKSDSSRLISAPLKQLALPRLQSLQLNGPVSAVHVCSVLNGASQLARLSLNLCGLDGRQSVQKHVVFREMLLSAIGRMDGLVSLELTLHGPGSSKRRWLTPWLTYQVVPPSAAHLQPSVRVHLREQVVDVLGQLRRLELLSVNLYSLARSFPRFRLDPSSLVHDMRRLASMLPRLRVVWLCNHVLRERDGPL